LENLIGVVSAPEIDLGDDGTTGPPSSWTDQPSSQQLKPSGSSVKPKLGSSGSHPVVKMPSSSSDVPLPSIAETLPGNRPAPVLPRPQPATPIAATPAPRPKSWHGESAGEPQPSTKG